MVVDLSRGLASEARGCCSQEQRAEPQARSAPAGHATACAGAWPVCLAPDTLTPGPRPAPEPPPAGTWGCCCSHHACQRPPLPWRCRAAGIPESESRAGAHDVRTRGLPGCKGRRGGSWESKRVTFSAYLMGGGPCPPPGLTECEVPKHRKERVPDAAPPAKMNQSNESGQEKGIFRHEGLMFPT